MLQKPELTQYPQSLVLRAGRLSHIVFTSEPAAPGEVRSDGPSAPPHLLSVTLLWAQNVS